MLECANLMPTRENKCGPANLLIRRTWRVSSVQDDVCLLISHVNPHEYAGCTKTLGMWVQAGTFCASAVIDGRPIRGFHHRLI